MLFNQLPRAATNQPTTNREPPTFSFASGYVLCAPIVVEIQRQHKVSGTDFFGLDAGFWMLFNQLPRAATNQPTTNREPPTFSFASGYVLCAPIVVEIQRQHKVSGTDFFGLDAGFWMLFNQLPRAATNQPTTNREPPTFSFASGYVLCAPIVVEIQRQHKVSGTDFFGLDAGFWMLFNQLPRAATNQPTTNREPPTFSFASGYVLCAPIVVEIQRQHKVSSRTSALSAGD